MSRILVVTSPARGHLYPLVPTMVEMRRRGHEISVRTMASEVARLESLGLDPTAIDPAIEAHENDDWRARTKPGALLAACRTFIARGRHEIGDLRRAIGKRCPDLLYVDINSWGAAAAAEASGLPWASFAPYFLPLRAAGVPPWGLGLAPRTDLVGRVRDATLWPVLNALHDRSLAALNALRASAGATPLRHVADFATRAPLVVAYTAEPFEYPREWPSNVSLVGPGIWEPGADADAPEADDPRPLVLVTCSTEYQHDDRLIATALRALAGEAFRVVATTGAIAPETFERPANARIERFLPHGPLLREAACVVCHGGMGITQKALAAGVPVCVVPFGRDQIEVARHVEVADAGSRLAAGRLSPERLHRAIRAAMARRPGAERVAAAFRRAGGASAAADAIEGLIGGARSAPVPASPSKASPASAPLRATQTIP
jgi:MGT family glycosyltransferase